MREGAEANLRCVAERGALARVSDGCQVVPMRIREHGPALAKVMT